jgi:hypothetical protein
MKQSEILKKYNINMLYNKSILKKKMATATLKEDYFLAVVGWSLTKSVPI